MSKDKKKRGGSSQEGSEKKKPKNPLMNKLFVDSQKKFFEGRRLLLKTKNIYKNKKHIPDGADDYLWYCLKCWNLERVIDAELVGAPEPEQLTMEDLINEMESGVDYAE